MSNLKGNRLPVALSIAGFDPSGGAGVVADIKTFTAFGCFATAAVTSLTFQNTLAVYGAATQTAETVRSQVLPVIEDFNVKGGHLKDKAENTKKAEGRGQKADEVIEAVDVLDDEGRVRWFRGEWIETT